MKTLTIYVEGPQGSGRTELLQLIQDLLLGVGYSVGDIEECEEEAGQLPCECVAVERIR